MSDMENKPQEAAPFQPPTMVEVDGKLIGFYFARNKYWYRVFGLWRDGYFEEITGAIRGAWVGNETGIVQAIKDYSIGEGLVWSYEPEYLARMKELQRTDPASYHRFYTQKGPSEERKEVGE